MFFHGKEWKPSSMIDALNGGIGIIVQENGTIPQISVAENMFLGELKNFSGTHYFEERKVENFSPIFEKGLLSSFDALADKGRKEIYALLDEGERVFYACQKQIKLVKKDKILSDDEKAKKIAELKDKEAKAKEVVTKNSSKLAELRKDYVAKLKAELDKTMLSFNADVAAKRKKKVEEYNAQSLENFNSFQAKLTAVEEKYNTIYKTATDLKLERHMPCK
jgi:hypothetical protein